MQKDMSGPVEDKTFTIPPEKVVQFDAFREKHNRTCNIPEWMPDVTPLYKYTYQFQASGLGDNIHIVCMCGEKYYADAGDDMI